MCSNYLFMNFADRPQNKLFYKIKCFANLPTLFFSAGSRKQIYIYIFVYGLIYMYIYHCQRELKHHGLQGSACFVDSWQI